MCGCEGNIYEVGDFNTLQEAGRILVVYPALQWVCISVLTTAFLITEFVLWQNKKRAFRERSAYERQETVYYVGEQCQHLVRPVSAPKSERDELLRHSSTIDASNWTEAKLAAAQQGNDDAIHG